MIWDKAWRIWSSLTLRQGTQEYCVRSVWVSEYTWAERSRGAMADPWHTWACESDVQTAEKKNEWTWRSPTTCCEWPTHWYVGNPNYFSEFVGFNYATSSMKEKKNNKQNPHTKNGLPCLKNGQTLYVRLKATREPEKASYEIIKVKGYLCTPNDNVQNLSRFFHCCDMEEAWQDSMIKTAFNH